jgi:3'-phosphoadenosine 5'-phosphosulfate sulfotransferase (PAPS reductase)/FAD synthetase
MKELHVVALSGGKDSTAMALWLSENNPHIEFTYVCTPTGNELPVMFQHWSNLRVRLGGKFIPIIGGTLEGIIEKENAIPNFRMRFCTRMLKIEPYAAWLMKQSEHYDRIISYVGIRADEPEREGGDYTAVPGVEMRFPLRELGWTINDVMDFLIDRNIVIPERTDCAWCFYQTLGEWWILWKENPDLYQQGVDIEEKIGYTFRSESRDTWPAALKDLRAEFEKGRIPPRTNRQHSLFGQMQCRVCRT